MAFLQQFSVVFLQQFLQLQAEFNELLHKLLLIDEKKNIVPSHKRRLNDEEDVDEEDDRKRCRLHY